MLEQIAGYQDQGLSQTLPRRWLSHADHVLTLVKNGEAEQTSLLLLQQARKIITEAEEKIQDQARRIEELQRLSTTDELTGLVNRRGITTALTRELDRVNRDVSQGGLLIMIDLDNFKLINDSFGHEAGDTALKLMAQTLMRDTRTMDMVGRMGGDEFVLLFVNTTRKAALTRAESLIKKLNNLSFIWQGEEVPLRASLGLKSYGKGSHIDAIFAAADQDMYANKMERKKQTL